MFEKRGWTAPRHLHKGLEVVIVQSCKQTQKLNHVWAPEMRIRPGRSSSDLLLPYNFERTVTSVTSLKCHSHRRVGSIIISTVQKAKPRLGMK